MITPNPLRSPKDTRLHRISGPCALVIFGVTGDLSQKKLLPAIYDLAHLGLLSPAFTLLGLARRPWTDVEFATVVKKSVKAHARTGFDAAFWKIFAQSLRFVSGSFDDPDSYTQLSQKLTELEKERGTGGNHAFYLSIPPESFPVVTKLLHSSSLAQKRDGSWRRVIVEKPFGTNLKTAIELDQMISTVFAADSVFRIDHYLGKETVQNILAMRFANQMFEPIWNNTVVDHVQITMAEDIGVGGRAGYYDGIGAARDVIQNHLLQLLALTAMEEPLSLSAHDLRAEKEKVLAATRIASSIELSTARGQYDAGWQSGSAVSSYLNEKGISPGSRTETFAAIQLEIANRRWSGVPFYLRTGKRLGRRVTEIAVVFKKAPEHLFPITSSSSRSENAFVIRVQPDEGITLRFGAKIPGPGMNIRDVNMDFGYGHAFAEARPEAYERLILDVLLGDPPLFPQQQEVELSWKILDPVIEYWDHSGKPEQYSPGSWGPSSSDALLARSGRVWRRP